MLGLSMERLNADLNRLLALLFHQVSTATVEDLVPKLNPLLRSAPPTVLFLGVLDEQFLQFQQLQDETSPNFVSEVVNIYFHETEKLLRILRELLMENDLSDYKKMGTHLNQLTGSSSSIGAHRVRNVCVAFRAAAEQNNRNGCIRALEALEYEYCYLKSKLHEFFQIEQRRILEASPAAATYPVREQHPKNP